jgi:S-formylglutathione hydrolase FrmB
MKQILFAKLNFIAILMIMQHPVAAQKIKVRYNSTEVNNFSGNIYLYLSKDNKEPMFGNVGIESFPCFRIHAKNIKPGQDVIFDDAAVSYPVALSDIERGEYFVQAVWDETNGRAISESENNIYNKSSRIILTKNISGVFALTCDQKVGTKTFKETPSCKEISIHSGLLSKFYGKSTNINAAVKIPVEYEKHSSEKYPVLYVVFGYGGDYHNLSGDTSYAHPLDTTPCIRVFLDGNCSLGHSVYANSDNNGPWGDALVNELIPEIEKRFRCNNARFLTGHSSGGWSVLWLQTHYPKTFSGCWSSSPDPVDFRNFQRVNLYSDKNLFFGNDSSLRSVATIAGRIQWASMKQAYAMENVIMRGEQMRSFDAVFSQRNPDDSPRPMCNYITGEIDPVTVQHWKSYDISLYLREHWNEVQKDLQGKIRISVGNDDNFLLNYAVHLLDEEMQKLNGRFQFAYYPGDHFTIWTDEYYAAGNLFLEKMYNEYLKNAQ